jgi:hypothetical protein
MHEWAQGQQAVLAGSRGRGNGGLAVTADSQQVQAQPQRQADHSASVGPLPKGGCVQNVQDIQHIQTCTESPPHLQSAATAAISAESAKPCDRDSGLSSRLQLLTGALQVDGDTGASICSEFYAAAGPRSGPGVERLRGSSSRTHAEILFEQKYRNDALRCCWPSGAGAFRWRSVATGEAQGRVSGSVPLAVMGADLLKGPT